MDIEELFAKIKTNCDHLRLIASGTGKPSSYCLYKDHVKYRFTIGLGQWLGYEVMTVGETDPTILDKFMADRMLMPTDVTTTCDYDEINVSLSGTLAAIYGRHTTLQQLSGNYYP
jgi:hypothetical protein